MAKLTRDNLHNYQNEVINFAKTQPNVGLFLDMGLGKTIVSLTVASDYLDNFQVHRVLVIAPLTVANNEWKQQAQQWTHTEHLKVKICTGTAKARTAALLSDADIYVINRDAVSWLVKTFSGDWKWDMCIVDESSSFKDVSSQRFSALRKVINHFKHILILTGTPAPNGLLDIWTQIYLLDRGARLGANISFFKKQFFKKEHDGEHSKLILFPGFEHEILTRVTNSIKDICITMKATDHIDLPSKIDIIRYVELPPKVVKQYAEFKKELVLLLRGIRLTELDMFSNIVPEDTVVQADADYSEEEIVAANIGVLLNKLMQLCNGGVYTADKKYIHFHDEKIDCLKQLRAEYPNENMLVGYTFISDKERLLAAFPEAVALTKSGEEIQAWNDGKIKMLLAHPASAGYGLNLQYGGNMIVWFGLSWSLDLYQQFNARLHRMGQESCVRVIHIVAKGKVDDMVVMSALRDKARTQNQLIRQLNLRLSDNS